MGTDEATYSSTISSEDLALIGGLLDAGFFINDIADKMEVSPFMIVCHFQLTDFPRLDERVFNLRVKRGKMRVGEDCFEKSCSNCNEFLPFTFEFWNKNKASVDGAWHMCKSCEQQRAISKRANKKADT